MTSCNTRDQSSKRFKPFPIDLLQVVLRQHFRVDLKTKEPILRCNSSRDLYPLTTNFIKPPSKPIALAAVTQDRWHQRLGHPGKSLLHSDLWTSPVLSTGGHRYYILFLDDLTDFLWTYPLTNKSQVYNTFTNFHNHIHTQFKRKIKQFQCDNGTEYTNNNFKQFCHINGMHFRFSCPHTSSQNDKAERKIRTINNMIRTLLSQASLPPSFWHHALETATYLLNILPKKTHKFLSPSTLLYNVLPTYTHLRVFGCLCYPTTPSTTINKLTNRSKPCVFLGYPSNHRGYKCFDISNNQIFISRHVQFEESIFPFSIQHSNTTLDYNFLSPPFNPLLWDNVHSSQPISPPNAPHPTSLGPTPAPLAQTLSPPSAHPSDPASNTQTPPQLSPQPTPPHSVPQQPPRTMRTRAMDGITKPKQLFNLNTTSIVPILKTPYLALSTPEWYDAMQNEFSALIKNGTWETSTTPLGHEYYS
ncbi:hypothetical protein OSB04_019123 [Centaurea solstitialis]|uniref:Integrase catalytic domain-containing protein n=1 Tax=Centaurea solstitialis TaxID=347529 RepID=A0AA38T1Y4_9ASTR|nr:hypothetical protein OSB04_019123 [Centaurea solstitialis]